MVWNPLGTLLGFRCYPPVKHITNGAAFLSDSHILFNLQQRCRYACSQRRTFMTSTPRMALFFASAMAFALAGSGPLLAAEATTKVLAENDKLQIIDVVEKPGDTGAMALRLGNAIYVISGGTFERTYADGTKEVTPRKSGEAAIIKEKRPYSVKNVGTTTIHLIEFLPKK